MSADFDFSRFQFSPVIHLPEGYEVYDFTVAYDPKRARSSPYGIGRYNEYRPGMYGTELFSPESVSARDVHVGLDIGAPIGTPVHAFYEGTIYMTAINSKAGDYGGTLITEHKLGERTLWALHGHLSHASTWEREPGERFAAGDLIARVGAENENGGWNPHLHFQLSWRRPGNCDLPGVVNKKDLIEALAIYPDPRLVLGPIY